MCGIFVKINYISQIPVQIEEIKTCLNVMHHRGPDEEGIFLENYIGLGVKRLKVIDIKGGSQPITNETDSLVIVYNGEIFNYIPLREQLQKMGHKFKTKSDTEVILHLYEEKGVDCLNLLNGMFAFVIWDKEKKELFVARDRIGIKPLFYADFNGTLIISSEIRSILYNNTIPRDIDNTALIDYLSFYYISAPSTIYNYIKRLLPGHYLILDNKNNIKINRYWHFAFKPENIGQNEAIYNLKEIMKSSVKRHLQSEVPIGVFLSSGLDSSTIVAFMSKYVEKIRTYTVGYENGKSFNELEGARLIAKRYKTIHSECILKPSHISEFLPYVIQHLAEPHGDWTGLALYYLSQQSKPDSTVVISGAGGDELFAGYPTLIAAKLSKFYNILPESLKSVINKVVYKLPVSYTRLSFDFKAKSFLRGANLEPERAHLIYKEIFNSAERKKLLYNYNINERDPFEVYRQHLTLVSNEKTLNRLIYLDLNVFLPDCALHLTDMVTSLNSQECRVPLLDLEMLEFSQKLPLELKIRGTTTKYIFRKAFSDYIPQKVIKMPKKGLCMPTSVWLKKELSGFVKDIINLSKQNTILNKNFINEILNEHLQGKKDNTRKITCIISFLLWENMYHK